MTETENWPPDLNKLPTTPEIADDGVVVFREIAHRLTPRVRGIFIRDSLHLALLGISPEKSTAVYPVSQENITGEEIDAIRQAFGGIARRDDYLLMDGNPVREGKSWTSTLSIINLRAAALVIDNYWPNFPTEAYDKPKQWLEAHPSEWRSNENTQAAQIHIRHGLLSGFPFSAVQFYPRFKTIRDRKDAGFTLTAEEQLILENGKFRSGTEFTPFFGFDAYLESRYIQRLKRIYYRSGMDRIINEFKRRRP